MGAGFDEGHGKNILMRPQKDLEASGSRSVPKRGGEREAGTEEKGG